MKLFRIQVWNDEGDDLTFIFANEVFTTMTRAARYGERQMRIHGWKYRIRPVYINLIEAF